MYVCELNECSPQDCRKAEGLINIHTNYVIVLSACTCTCTICVHVHACTYAHAYRNVARILCAGGVHSLYIASLVPSRSKAGENT